MIKNFFRHRHFLGLVAALILGAVFLLHNTFIKTSAQTACVPVSSGPISWYDASGVAEHRNFDDGVLDTDLNFTVNPLNAKFKEALGKLQVDYAGAPWQTSGQALPGSRLKHSSVTANGYVYVIGGSGGGTVNTDVFYAKLNSDGSVGAWSSSISLPVPRYTHGSVVANGYVYVIGGHSGGAGVDTVYYAQLNPDGSTGAWTLNANSLPAARYNLTAGTANGYVYAIGGNSGAMGVTTVYYAKQNIDGSLGAWSATTALPGQRQQHATFVDGNKLYVIGGYDDQVGAVNTVYYAQLNADGTVGAWSANANVLPETRMGLSVGVANGYVYALGGAVSIAGAIQSTVYYAALNSDGSLAPFVTANPLPAVRERQTTVVANGFVYAIGGTDAFGGGDAAVSTIYYVSAAKPFIPSTPVIGSPDPTNASEVSKAFAAPLHSFAVEATLRGDFTGTNGSKRANFGVRDSSGGGYTIQIGKDAGATFQGKICRLNFGCSGVTYGSYSNNTDIRFRIEKTGSVTRVFIVGLPTPILEEPAQMGDMVSEFLGIQTANGADPFTAYFDDWDTNFVTDIADSNVGVAQKSVPLFGPGMVGDAMIFDGTQRVDATDASNLDITGPLTLEAWVKYGGFIGTVNAPIIAKWGDTSFGTAGYGLYVLPSGSVMFVISNDGLHFGAQVVSSKALPVGVYTHVAAVYDGTMAKLYVNGVLDTSLAYSGPVFANNANLVIGANNPVFTAGATGAIIGELDEVKVYNRGLSATEIQSIFAAGSGGACKPGGPSVGTISVTSPASGTVTNQSTVTVTGTATGDVVSVTCNNITATLINLGFSIAIPLIEGSNSIYCQGKDAAAAPIQGAIVSFPITLDTHVPDTTLGTAVDGNNKSITNGGTTNSNTMFFAFSGIDNLTPASQLKFTCALDGATPFPCVSPLQVSVVDGSHTFSVAAIDTAGNVDPTPAIFAWTVDATPPVITGVPVITPNVASNQVSVSVQFTDATGLRFATAQLINITTGAVVAATTLFNGGSATGGTLSGIMSVPPGTTDGTYAVKATLVDIYGNIGTTEIGRLIVDQTAPIIQMISVPSFTRIGAVTITASIIDLGSGVSSVTATNQTSGASASLPLVSGSSAMGQAGTYQGPISLAKGTNAVIVVAGDLASPPNTQTAKVSVTFDPDPPIITLSTTPTLTNQTLINLSVTTNEVITLIVNGQLLTAAPGAPQVVVVPLISEGLNTINITATDLAGNVTTKAVTIIRDTTPPTVQSSTLTPNITSNTVASNLSISDVNGVASAVGTVKNSSGAAVGTVAFSLASGNAFTGVWNGSFTFPATLPDGSYTLEDTVTDAAGNRLIFIDATIVLDRTAPSLSVSSIVPAYANANTTAVIVAVSTSDLNGVRLVTAQDITATPTQNPITLTVNPTQVGSFSGTVTISPPEGSHVIQFKASDIPGNTAIQTGMFVLDTTFPILNLATLPTLTKNPSLAVSGSASDVNLASLKVNGQLVTVASDGTFSRTLTLVEGLNAVTVAAEDKAGNVTTLANTVELDTTAPVVTLTSTIPPATTNPILTISGNVVDGNGSTLTINGTPVTITNGAFTFTLTLTPGVNTITIVAADSLGNTKTTKFTVTFNTNLDSDGDGVPDNADSCPRVAGPASQKGCPFADKTNVTLHIVDQQKSGICGTLPDGKPRGECKKPLGEITVKVFDRGNPDFIATYGTRPLKHLLNLVYESDVAKVGQCVTDTTGTCISGEDHPGKFLVVAKYTEGSKSAYFGKFKNLKPKSIKSDEDDDDDDVGVTPRTIVFKNLRLLKTIKKDGTITFNAGQMTVITGSELDVVYPEYTVWDGTTELYPFVLTSADTWTTNVCLQVPVGYKITGVLNDDGTIVSTSDCVQSFVSGESKVFLFSVTDVGSPEPKVGFTLNTEHKGKKTQHKLEIDGIRKASKSVIDQEVRGKIERGASKKDNKR